MLRQSKIQGQKNFLMSYSEREKEVLKAVDRQRYKFYGAIAAIKDIYGDVTEDITACGEVDIIFTSEVTVTEEDLHEVSHDLENLDLNNPEVVNEIAEMLESVYEEDCPEFDDDSRS